VTHEPGCAGWRQCGGTFVCGCCGKRFGWCRGGGDECDLAYEPDGLCSDCWALHHRKCRGSEECLAGAVVEVAI